MNFRSGRLSCASDPFLVPRLSLVACRCDCGKEVEILAVNLRYKNRRTTYCTRKCPLRPKPPVRLVHGLARRGEQGWAAYIYTAWEHIKHRCFKENDPYYHAYGGRGITLYGPRITDPGGFASYVENTIGRRPKGHSIDRINNDGNYEPGNLRWATPKAQG